MSGSWLDDLQPASWRDIPFAVKASEYRRGRRFALHEYPKRDLPWPEDMGRASRIVGFSGFVVGDDCFDQAQSLLDAAEEEGSGQLVHPSLGLMTVALVEPLTASERADLGRVVEIRFEFVEAGDPLYPGDDDSTQDQVSDWSDNTQTASADDFTTSVGGPSPNDVGGAGSLGSAGTPTTYTDATGKTSTIPASSSGVGYQANVGSQTITSWGNNASQQAADPSLTAGAAASVQPPAGQTFGRFDGIGSLSFTTGSSQDAIDGQVEQRNEVDDAADKAARAALIS